MLSLDQWFSHIKQIHHKRMDFGLDRIGLVANKLSLTQFSCPVITVAGTNGKGSCVKTLETIYTQAGYRVGLYTSPHLLDFNERIRIDNKNCDDDALMKAFSVIEAARDDIILSFFEFTTLAALYLFQQANCDVLILEVGLGGRLDAVNIVESDVAVLTSVALDHMEYLGSDRESIAYEKASIARENKPFICGEEDPPASIAKTVADKKAILYQINRDFFYQQNGCNLTSTYERRALATSQQYVFQTPKLKPQNIATAIAVVEALQQALPITEKNITDGIQNTQWPGRFDIISTPFECILDVAHNPHAAQWLAQQYQQLPLKNNAIAVVGMLKDKAMCDTVSQLLPLIDTWFVCDLSITAEERGADGKVIAAFLKQNGKNCVSFASVSDAMDALFQAHCQQRCDRGLIFGSFYTVAQAKRWLTEGADQWKKKPSSV